MNKPLGKPVWQVGLGERPPCLAVPVKHQVGFIETTFGLRVSWVAGLIGVTRQAIYDWKQGKTPSGENYRKLNALYTAAQHFKEAGLKLDYATKHRTIGGELEFIRALAGPNPVEAVQKLIVVLKRGHKQRESLDKLLKDRPDPGGSVADELPPHYPGE